MDSKELGFTLLFVLSLTGTKISDEITGAALASCLAKAEKLAALKYVVCRYICHHIILLLVGS